MGKRSGLLGVAALVVLGAETQPAAGQGRLSRDPDDGALDMSAFLATSHGFLPVATLITEPALGFGGALGLAFLHRPKDWDIDDARAAFEARERLQPPSLSTVFGMYTSNNSWAAGAAHIGQWGGGRWRYLGSASLMRLNLSIAGEAAGGQEVLFDYGLEGWAVTQSLRYRLGESDWWVGALFDYLEMTTVFTIDKLPGLDPIELDSSLGSLAMAVRYDSRNSTFTPDRGLFADVAVRRRAEWIGSDFEYWAAKGTLLAYVDPTDALVLGLRVEGSAAGEAAPFWARPSVGLRGVARNRYSSDRAGVFEGEVRWDLTRRWSAVGFGGAGWTTTLDDTERENRWVGGGGAGVRYLLARAFGIRGGADLAYGSDGWAFYITMGSAWGGI